MMYADYGIELSRCFQALKVWMSLNVVCFRYLVPDAGAEALNELNRELLVALQESGVAVPSLTVLDGRTCLRLAITNHHTRRADLDALLAETLRIGRALHSGVRTGFPELARPLPPPAGLPVASELVMGG